MLLRNYSVTNDRNSVNHTDMSAEKPRWKLGVLKRRNGNDR